MSAIRILPLLVSAICFGTLAGCNDDPNSPGPDPGTEITKVNPAGTNESLIVQMPIRDSNGSGDSMFTEMTPEETGVVFTNLLNPKNLRKYLLNGAGLCTGDYDNDGLVDMYLVCQDGPNKLYRQVSDWKFEDVTESAGGLDGSDYWGRGATFADIENDGDLDLYLCNANGPNQLYVNQGDGTFKADNNSRGANHLSATTMATFADYDRDGDLDIYLVNNRLFAVGEERPNVEIIVNDGKQMVKPEYREHVYIIQGRIEESGQQDILLQNDGTGHFTDVTAESGISGYDMGLSATWWDYNNDGWLDLYVGNDFKMSDHLYRNNGDGTFTDELARVIPHTSWFSMGADAADLNSDGILDFMVADMSSTTHYKQKTTMGEMGRSAWFLTMGNPRQFMRNACYLSTGSRRFMEVANLTGLDSTDWTWSVKFGDYDNDGLIDVFVTNGYGKNDNDSDFQAEYKRLNAEGKKEEAEALFLSRPPLEENNILFKNMGDLKFKNVAPDWGVDHFGVSIGASAVDIDKDGDLDLVVSHLNDPISLYRNNSVESNRVLVDLDGTVSNREGIGAKITIETEHGTQVRQVITARGYVSSDEAVTHFGLGEADKIKKLRVQWPSGIESVYTDLEANQRIKITEPNEPSRLEQPVFDIAKDTQFKNVGRDVGLSVKHQEKPYDDYLREPLLPNKLSQLGPGLAWGDVNGDSLMDCYIGGAAGQAGTLYLQNSQNSFTEMFDGPWNDDADREDMGALFFDFDSDGDEDLYVVSGGVECEIGAELLKDRLYINEGGKFTAASEGVVPDLRNSGSTVAGCDFDRDGDIDLFVGGRVIPGRWPLAARSTILRNESGKFIEATEEIANGLSEIGLVTGATWTHIDDDGWPDLALAVEWGPVSFFKNTGGKLENVTRSLGLSEDTGWFNGIASVDVDNDGDLDFIATNFGLNTKYHASHDHPSQLFVSDFDDDGRLDLVEAEWEGDTCFPIRGRSCSSHAMPFIKEKFESYHEFGLAELNEIYTDTKLEESSQFAASRLESVLIINNGQQPWTIKNLPRLAQASPGFGIVTSDFNADGNMDIYFVQNFMEPQPETGQMDGGLSCFLTGDGSGNFEFVYAGESGLVVRRQGMAATLCDLNRDGWPDITVTTNNGRVGAFLNNGVADRSMLKLSLAGDTGNQRAFGSLVTIIYSDGSKQAIDVSAGSGYLSQSTGEIFVATGGRAAPEKLQIRWPDGSKSETDLDSKDRSVVINKSVAN